MMNRAAQRGLTLPELLIALLVFAMISGAAVYALRLSIEGREQLEEADAAIRDMQIARLILKQDLAQVALRRVRDEFGNSYPAEFLGGAGLSFRQPKDGEQTLLAFVRRGWDNPEARAPRSTLQAVEYVLVGETLVRRVRPYLDDARNQPRTDRVLLTRVTAATVKFFVRDSSSGLVWSDVWPGPSQPGASFAPEAVGLTLTTPRYGELEQLFWIGEIAS